MTGLFEHAALQRLRRAAPYALVAGVAGGLAMLYVWDPATTGMYPPCPFRALTGYYCPGCGSTRATHQLLHGHVGNALRLNPLMVISLPLLAYAVAAAKWPGIQVGWIRRITSTPAWPLAILVVVVLYWLLRNLPIEPFSWLAPH